MHSPASADRSNAREGYAALNDVNLFYRDVGQGQPTMVLHGGPDFDHRYLLPELDRLSDVTRLVYYDQRGRGRSAPDATPESVSIESEIDDLEGLRTHFGLETVAVLGHSWGGLLALEYAIRHPERVSHLVLMNSAPVSHEDLLRFRGDREGRDAADLKEMKAIAATPRYQAGELDADAEYYRAHFRNALHRPELVDRVVERLRMGVTPAGIRKARAIEDRLYEQTWSSPHYDLLPQAARLGFPTLVLHGESDFVPVACSERIARAIPGARLVVLSDCGHFSYLERPDEVHAAVAEFFDR